MVIKGVWLPPYDIKIYIIRRWFNLKSAIVDRIDVLSLFNVEKLLSEIAFVVGAIKFIFIQSINSENLFSERVDGSIDLESYLMTKKKKNGRCHGHLQSFQKNIGKEVKSSEILFLISVWVCFIYFIYFCFPWSSRKRCISLLKILKEKTTKYLIQNICILY